jgi:tRNA-2-methylthio-N6-dimethylallyladenosine synthase
VGFPGETEPQFQNTYNLLEELRLDKAHIARYSARPRTVATRQMDDNLPYEVKERRRKALDDLQSSIVTELNSRYLGQVVDVLVEGKHERKERWFGRTVTDRLVFFPSDAPQLGRLAHVKVTWAGPWSLIGELYDPNLS